MRLVNKVNEEFYIIMGQELHGIGEWQYGQDPSAAAVETGTSSKGHTGDDFAQYAWGAEKLVPYSDWSDDSNSDLDPEYLEYLKYLKTILASR